MKPDEFDGRLPLTADACKKWHEDELRDGIITPDVHGSRRTCRRMVRIARTLPMLVLPADATVDETTWVRSDLHIGHQNIIKHANRPFRNAKEMDDALYRNWAETVGADERLIVVGDVAMSWSVGLSTWERIEALPGKPKHLIFGNHDLDYHGNLKVGGFDDTSAMSYAAGDPPLILTHIPLNNVPPGAVNIHGHTHQAPCTESPNGCEPSGHVPARAPERGYEP